MANYNRTKLTCNDLHRFSEIINDNPFTWPHTGQAYEEEPIELEGNGFAYIESRNSDPHKEIKQMSAKNPDLTFTAEYSYESDWYSVIHTVEYTNGKCKELDQKANYLLTMIDTHGFEDNYNKLIDRAEEIFERMDTVLEDGVKKIDFIGEKVILTVEDDNYQIRLSKEGCMIETIGIFKKQKVASFKPVPITVVHDIDFDLPF